MTYLKAFLCGLGGSVVAVIIWVVCGFFLPLYLPQLMNRGSGGIGFASIGSGSVLLAALIGFIVGVVWKMRRLRLI